MCDRERRQPELDSAMYTLFAQIRNSFHGGFGVCYARNFMSKAAVLRYRDEEEEIVDKSCCITIYTRWHFFLLTASHLIK